MRVTKDLKRGEPSLTKVFHQALVDAIIEKFPCVFSSHTLPTSDRALVSSLTNLFHVLQNASRAARRL